MNQKRQNGNPFCLFGAGNQNRTDDLVITNDVLYRLSHTSMPFADDFDSITDSYRFVNTFFQFFSIFLKLFFRAKISRIHAGETSTP